MKLYIKIRLLVKAVYLLSLLFGHGVDGGRIHGGGIGSVGVVLSGGSGHGLCLSILFSRKCQIHFE